MQAFLYHTKRPDVLLAVEVMACREAHEDRVDHIVNKMEEGCHQQTKILAQPEKHRYILSYNCLAFRINLFKVIPKYTKIKISKAAEGSHHVY